jgi:hypothetical protein
MRHVPKLIDVAIMAALCLFSASVGRELLATLQAISMTEAVTPAAMVACGYGLVNPGTPTPELQAFARRERTTLACAEVAGDGRVLPVTKNVASTRYAVYSVALAFRLGGISWRTLDWYLGATAGLSMALAYALFRLAAGRIIATLGVVALIFSNHTLAIALDFRDFGKEFWFIAAWLAIGWLLRRGQPAASPAIYGPAAAAGTLLGIGLGFRVDLVIILPAVVAVIVFALPGVARAALTAKAIGAVIFLATFLVTGAPILGVFSDDSSVSHVVVLGLMTPFTDALGIEPSPYDIGDLYADGFAAASIFAHARLVDHDRKLGIYGTHPYDRQGISLLKDLAWRFPADAVVRALGATRQVIANPFDPDADREAATIGALTRTPARLRILRWRAAADHWLHGHELILIATVFFAIAVRDRRLAVIATLVVLYFSGYSMLQFARRHTFQLDVIPTGMLVVALSAGVSLVSSAIRRRLRADPKAVFGAVITGAALAALAAAGLTLIRAWQQPHVTALFERTLAAPSVDLAMTREPLAGSAGPDGQPTGLLLRPAPGAWPEASGEALFHAEYLVLELGGAQCGADMMRLVVRYSSIYHTSDSDYTRGFIVPLTGGVQLLVPIFELPGLSHFDGVSVAVDRAACIHRIHRLSPADGAPLPNLFAVLPANWRSTPLYQRLRDTTAPPGFLPLLVRHDR